MWMTIYITPSVKTAEKIQDKLTNEGFLVKIKPGLHGKHYEIMVPKGELNEVKETLSSILQ